MKDQTKYLESHIGNRFRQGVINPFISSAIPQSAKTILDLGCGAAEYHELILQQHPYISLIIGADSSKEMLENIKNIQRTKYLCFDATKQTQEQKVDCIISVLMIQLLKTVQQIQEFILNCSKQLKENGSIHILSIDTNKLIKSQAYGKAIDYKVFVQNELKDGQQYKIRLKEWEFYDTHWSPTFLTKKFLELGFLSKIHQIKPQVISKQFYSQDQIKQIVQSKSIYYLTAFRA